MDWQTQRIAKVGIGSPSHLAGTHWQSEPDFRNALSNVLWGHSVASYPYTLFH